MSSTPNVELVIFDMAGTTVKDNNEVQNCFFVAAEQTGLQASGDRVNAMMGWSKKLVFQTLWREQLGGDHPDYQQNVEVSYQRFKETLEHHYQTQPVEPTEGCLELFDWLKFEEIKIGLNTGFYREVTDIILRRLGWDKGLNQDYVGSEHSYIQVSVTPSEIYNNEGRPAPYMIQKAMYKLGVKNPQTVIVVGDTPSDLEAGLNAHCLMTLGVTNGTHRREQLAQYPNDGLLDSLRELKEKITA
ncbi:HAD hydrolase-like protein [Roseofilum reptotaenium CS-1145]|uniref:Phosphatase n=1 Tax=Roseofilum reptotaenium AO1-A TaxID=1925591 RepID=A0A1L9QLY1_9CYAN|nr:HAD hydrolase-like protein [Roseofilum reptotaenium]MDB9517452.1 HAD hydrolase-like protein [Roseofilum reptotaenium CS-1145]OJJ20700.1 phosphatase [Roseofilum reptotaenium AO1-A]